MTNRGTVIFRILAACCVAAVGHGCGDNLREGGVFDGGGVGIDAPIVVTDADSDGFAVGDDCDDSNAAINPDADEVCDGVDNDCDGAIDEDDATDAPTWYLDGDSDGYGLDSSTKAACDQPSGYAAVGGDCDDGDPAFHPMAPESCAEAVDYNCDGSVAYQDADMDGVAACNDCDDADPANFPGNAEICDGQDNDCSGTADFAGELIDADMDGALSCNDCDDAEPARFPGNTEICDGLDNDCSGTADFVGELVDGDMDGSPSCNDCDDADPANFPGNAEICDGQDNDCSGTADFAGELIDGDMDGFLSCNDCDDADPAKFPGNTEVCDGEDNDCDTLADEDMAVVMCGDVPNATVVCNGALGCGVGTCSGDFVDTDALFSNGCECLTAPAPITTGNACANAFNLGTLSDVSAASVTVGGNAPTAGRAVWYVVNATDDLDTNGDEFHFDTRFVANPGNGYAMDVYRNGCPGVGTQLALGEATITDWFTDFNRGAVACTTMALCGEGNCSSSSIPGRNICNDDSATFYIRIYRPSGDAVCGSYSLQVSNGFY